MASSKEYLNFILDALDLVSGISYRYMMGEYVIYYKEKVVAGIYDNRFLIKPTDKIKEYIGKAKYEIPYPGGKEMIMIDNIDDREYLKGLFDLM